MSCGSTGNEKVRIIRQCVLMQLYSFFCSNLISGTSGKKRNADFPVRFLLEEDHSSYLLFPLMCRDVSRVTRVSQPYSKTLKHDISTGSAVEGGLFSVFIENKILLPLQKNGENLLKKSTNNKNLIRTNNKSQKNIISISKRGTWCLNCKLFEFPFNFSQYFLLHDTY